MSITTSENALPVTAVPASVLNGIGLVLVCNTFLSQFGVNLDFYSVNFSFIAYYALFLFMWFKGFLRIDQKNTFVYIVFAILSSASLILNKGQASISSMLLLLVLYLPFIAVLSPRFDIKKASSKVMTQMATIAFFIAVAGIIQFFLQFVIHDDWLFNFMSYVPKQWHSVGGWNTVIPIGSYYKSNGFFIAEPSGFSQFMAAAILAEINISKRVHVIATCLLGLLLSYSGSGILLLIVASAFPFSPKVLVRFLLMAAVGGFILLTLGDTLNLWATVDRVGEFGAKESSAYERFIAPFFLVSAKFLSNFWTPFIGNGPGAISAAAMSYGSHDPTWAKLLYEYGVLGTTGCLFIVLRAARRNATIPVQMIALFVFWWLIGGGELLSPNMVSEFYVLLAIWPFTKLDLDCRKNKGAPWQLKSV